MSTLISACNENTVMNKTIGGDIYKQNTASNFGLNFP